MSTAVANKNHNTTLAISLKQAIANISEKFPEEAKTIQAFMNKDVRVLGTDEIFTLCDSHGEIRAFKQALTLSAHAGTLVQPVPGGPLVVSAQGYEVWQEAAGASVIFPKEVLVDGQWQQNPAIIRDKQNRRILCIYARAVAFRFSSKGIPQVSDWTTIFDTPSYRLIDLLGKAKKFPQAFKLYPAEMGKPEDPGTWASYPFDESTNLWVNTAHEEALTWFAQILNREKKAIDFAQTFAKRNALKHLSGIQKAPGDNWTVPVICWRPTSGNIIKWDATTYANLQERAGRLLTSRGEDFASGGTAIEHKCGTERVSDEEGYETHEGVTDPEDQDNVVDTECVPAEEPEPEPEPQPQPAKNSNPSADYPKPNRDQLSPEGQKVMANYDETRAMFPAEFEQACLEIGYRPEAVHSVSQAEAIVRKVGAILDSQNQ
jgi:hypothetical protein